MDETIYTSSPVGKRLKAIKRNEKCCVLFNGKKVPLITKITIGREKDNDLVLDNKLISRYHAYIQKIKNEYFIRDLHSANGTFVNGKQIESDKYYKITSKDTIIIANMEVSIQRELS